MYTIIVGCGRVGAELAHLLASEGHDIIVIDQKESSFARLGDAFNGITIKGSGFSAKTLQQAGIEKANIFCALTNSDNSNIMASQIAKGLFKVPRVLARVYDPAKAEIYKFLGLDVLSETTLFASMIRDKIIDKHLSSYLIETNELGTIEFPVHEQHIGKTVDELNRPGEVIITAVQRMNKQVIIPEPKTVLVKGDHIVAVVKTGSIDKVKKEFGLEGD